MRLLKSTFQIGIGVAPTSTAIMIASIAGVSFSITSNSDDKFLSVFDFIIHFAFKILERSKDLLLQMATPDAIARLSSTRLKDEASHLWTWYFDVQCHDSLPRFLSTVIEKSRQEHTQEYKDGLLIQVNNRTLSVG